MTTTLLSATSDGKPADENRFSSFLIHSRNEIKVILFDEVMYCRAENNYTRIYLHDGRIEMICKTLKEMQLLLFASQFVRIHANCVVNLHMIRRILHAGQCSAELMNDVILNVSRSRRKELIRRLERHYNDRFEG